MTTEQSVNRFVELAAIDCSKHIEKKGKPGNQLAYLSWVWAVDQLLRRDPDAEWSYGTPIMYGDTMMVVCTVTAFGKPRTSHLPVMDHTNKAVPNPNAFQVNTAMQRCLVKAIALHGLGLYIYAGEDLPPNESGDPMPTLDPVVLASLESCADMDALKKAWGAIPQEKRDAYRQDLQRMKAKLAQPSLAEQA